MKLKPGITTSEFWLTSTGAVIVLSSTVLGQLDWEAGALLISAMTTIYTVIRGLVKKEDAKFEPLAKEEKKDE